MNDAYNLTVSSWAATWPKDPYFKYDGLRVSVNKPGFSNGSRLPICRKERRLEYPSREYNLSLSQMQRMMIATWSLPRWLGDCNKHSPLMGTSPTLHGLDVCPTVATTWIAHWPWWRKTLVKVCHQLRTNTYSACNTFSKKLYLSTWTSW